MKPIAFTQYLLPDGRKMPIEIDRPEHIAHLAAELVTSGCCLEIEMLMTGEISMAVENGDDTWAIEIVPNGPQVPEAGDKMICDAYRKMPQRGLVRIE